VTDVDPSPIRSGGSVPRSRIGINLTWLVPGIVGGSEEYSVRLLEGLVGEIPAGVQVRLYGRADLFDSHPGLVDGFETVTMPIQPVSKLRRIVLEQTWLAEISRLDDLVHHMGGTVPLRGRPARQRQVVTIHDLQPLDLPGNFHRSKRLWLGRMIPRATRSADLIVAPSRFTAERLTTLLAVPDRRIRVVHHGFEAQESATDSAGSVLPLDRRAANPTEIKLSGRSFLLYPAIAYKHKRHRDLVEALALARHGSSAERFDDLHVVFTGRRGPESDELDRLVAARGLKDRVHVLGRIPEAELDWLYRHALALVFPSEYEGFGNPCLEAMSRGCPVVVASAGALPEVVGEAALQFPAGDHRALVERIDRLLSEPHTVAGLVAAGYEQARRFTPGMASQRLWSVYRELLTAVSGDLGRRP